MKKVSVFLTIFPLMLLFNISVCRAEKVYYKDGRIADVKIIYRTAGSVWARLSSGAVGISLKDIDRIEDDSGTISKYDYESLSGGIQNFIAQNRYGEAIRSCDLLLESFPDNRQVHYLRGLLNQKTGDLDRAAEDYNFLIKQGADDAQLFNNLGAISAVKNNQKEAQEFFNQAIERDPDIIETHNNLADLLLQERDYVRAVEEYTKVIKKEPGNTNALYNLGVVYLQAKDYPKARQKWEELLRIKPEDSKAKKALEYLDAKKW